MFRLICLIRLKLFWRRLWGCRMKEVYDKIWKLARPYYEKGRPMDINHVEWMIGDAAIVCKKEKLDDSILLPLVILHDVGYGVGEHVYSDKNLKGKYMEEGSRIARTLLEKIGYPKGKIKRIQDYISVHDNWIYGEHEIYRNDLILGTFTDLDYMWMATPKGFPALMKVFGYSKEEMIEFLDMNEKLENRPFVTETVKRLYESYMKDRRAEV